MPSIDDNRRSWSSFGWHERGDEWSAAWGGSQSLWRGTLLPRIGNDLPTGHVLEIAPGHGRITQFLLPLCARYTGVDLVEGCVASCRQRFANAKHAQFVPTDGRSLPGVADGSVDFVISWDSLVHVDLDVLTAYLHELARVLRAGARAFVHHSNLGAFRGANGQPTIDNPHWRDPGVDADAVQRAARDCGLRCVAQELVQWSTPHLQDCFTLLRQPDGSNTADRAATQRSEHPGFAAEMEHLQRVAALYRRD